MSLGGPADLEQWLGRNPGRTVEPNATTIQPE